ncbi:GWxTD domain-containing protein [bacterium]|nr:GWxTD domain-containing protein [bacterium]
MTVQELETQAASGNREIRLQLAHHYLKSEQFDKIVQLYKTDYKKKQCTSDEYKIYAIARLQSYRNLVITRKLIDRLIGDDLRHAKLALAEALKLDGHDIEAKFFTGVLNRIIGKDEEALKILYDVFEEDCNYQTYAFTEVASELSLIFIKKGDYDAVKKLHEKQLTTYPKDAWSKIQLAVAYGELDSADIMMKLFFEGLDQLIDQKQLFQLFEDCSIIATTDEKKNWKELNTNNDKKDFLRSFWKKRDPNPFDDINEALIQYFKRVHYAKAMYPKPQSPGFDDRGLIYVRFGKPDYIFYGSSDVNIRENESWIYYNLEGGLHFDFVLIGTSYELRPLGDASIMTQAIMGEKKLSDLYRERSHLDPYYTNIQFKFETGRYNSSTIESSFEYRRDYEKMLEYSQKQYFAFNSSTAPLFVNTRYATFKDSDQKSRLDFYYILPYSQMNFLDTLGAFKWSKNFAAIKIFDYKNYRDVVTLERENLIFADSMQQKTYGLVDEFRYSLNPGKYILAFQISNNDKQKFNVFQYEVFVRDYSADTLTISDIQLAAFISENDSTQIQFIKPHSAVKVIPNAAAHITRSLPLSIYFEIYNLTLDNDGRNSYEISYRFKQPENSRSGLFARIKKLFINEKKSSIASTTMLSGNSTTERSYISLDVSELNGGLIDLEIRVKDLITNIETYSNVELNLVDKKK